MASADRDVLRYLYRSVSYPQASKDGIQLKNLQRLCEKQNLHLSMSKILKILNDHPQFFRCFQDGLDITVSGRTELGLCDDHCRKDGCLMTNGECNGLHLCKFHILDTCSIQPETRCRYGHRWDTYHNKVLLSRHMLDGMPVNTVSLFLRPKLLPKICKYYNIVDGCRGGITGDKCPALHLCKHFITGQCKYEQECTRSHNVFDTQPRMILKKHGINVDGSPKRIVNQLRAAYESNDDGKMSYEVGYGEDHANLPIGSGLTFDTYPRHEYQKQNPREIPNVCMYYLQDACTSGESCPDVHCPTLFQWQYEDTNGDWVNVTGDANADIEINFCEPSCDTCYADVQGLGIIKVDLVSLSARVENGTELKVRRLGTQSCQVVPDWLHEFATKWMWFIEDDTKSWQEYGKVVINATLANIGSPNIEQAFLEDPEQVFSFSFKTSQYEIDFATMKLTSQQRRTSQNVRRRPELSYFTKDGRR